MTHEWQQPIRPLQITMHESGITLQVLFIRPTSNQASGWEVITISGTMRTNRDGFLSDGEE